MSGEVKLANVGGRASVLIGDGALDIERASGGRLGPGIDILTDLSARADLLALADEADLSAAVAFEESDLGPVARPGKVIGIALNYRDHAEESGLPVPEDPTVFAKFPSSVIGPYDDVIIGAELNRVDYEAEVVVAIGTPLRDVGPDAVWPSIAGVTVGQDITDRREQWRKPLSQFTLAKSYDTFSPCGPVLATLDEFSDPDDIQIIGNIDDVEVQRGRTSDLIFSVPVLVSWLSRWVTLEPGDLIYTGTPAGCGVRRTPRLYLADGMTITTQIPEVGIMRNRVTAK
jgi:2,4-didehydro-3-deoxy-L-rhamnonate hydrolase